MSSRRFLFSLRKSIEIAKLGPVDLGDWDELLQQPTRDLPLLLVTRAYELCDRSRYVEAARAADKLCELSTANPKQLYDAARIFGRCGESIRAEAGKALEAEQTQQRKTWTEKALAALEQAIAAGFNDFSRIRRDTDLFILRSLPGYQSLISGPEQPTFTE